MPPLPQNENSKHSHNMTSLKNNDSILNIPNSDDYRLPPHHSEEKCLVNHKQRESLTPKGLEIQTKSNTPNIKMNLLNHKKYGTNHRIARDTNTSVHDKYSENTKCKQNDTTKSSSTSECIEYSMKTSDHKTLHSRTYNDYKRIANREEGTNRLNKKASRSLSLNSKFAKLKESKDYTNSKMSSYLTKELRTRPKRQDKIITERYSKTEKVSNTCKYDDKYLKTSRPTSTKVLKKAINPNKTKSQEKVKTKPPPNKSSLKKKDFKEYNAEALMKEGINISKVSRSQIDGKCTEKKSTTPIKSVVQVKKNFDLNVPSMHSKINHNVEDLRKKLKRKLINQQSTKRDNLLITVQNNNGVENIAVKGDDEGKVEKTKEKDSNLQLKLETRKYKKIKLVINLVCEKRPDSNESETDENEYPLANVDLSFLDDFNVDDIVDCLNSPEDKNQVNLNINEPCKTEETFKNGTQKSTPLPNNIKNIKEEEIETKFIDLNMR